MKNYCLLLCLYFIFLVKINAQPISKDSVLAKFKTDKKSYKIFKSTGYAYFTECACSGYDYLDEEERRYSMFFHFSVYNYNAGKPLFRLFYSDSIRSYLFSTYLNYCKEQKIENFVNLCNLKDLKKMYNYWNSKKRKYEYFNFLKKEYLNDSDEDLYLFHIEEYFKNYYILPSTK